MQWLSLFWLYGVWISWLGLFEKSLRKTRCNVHDDKYSLNHHKTQGREGLILLYIVNILAKDWYVYSLFIKRIRFGINCYITIREDVWMPIAGQQNLEVWLNMLSSQGVRLWNVLGKDNIQLHCQTEKKNIYLI